MGHAITQKLWLQKVKKTNALTFVYCAINRQELNPSIVAKNIHIISPTGSSVGKLKHRCQSGFGPPLKTFFLFDLRWFSRVVTWQNTDAAPPFQAIFNTKFQRTPQCEFTVLILKLKT